MWVFDATPLIYLATVDALHVVEALEGRCSIPQQVYDEVVTAGLDAGYADARRIERRVDEGAFEVASVADTPLGSRLERHPNLSEADVAVLACAASRGGIAVMDEAAGRTVADVEDIETKGTAYIVLLSAKREVISVAEVRETIDAMLEAGWYCAPDLYTKVVRTLESIDEA